MKAAEITKAATDLVGGDRARTHGDKTRNHQIIADFWEVYIKYRPTGPLDAHDAACMMELLKIGRRLCGSFNIDDYVDGAGYAGVAGEIRAGKEAEQLRRDRSWADAAIADAALEGCPAGPAPGTAEDIARRIQELAREAATIVPAARMAS